MGLAINWKYKTSNQIITTVKEAKINDCAGTIDIVIIGTDTLFKVRSIIY